LSTTSLEKVAFFLYQFRREALSFRYTATVLHLEEKINYSVWPTNDIFAIKNAVFSICRSQGTVFRETSLLCHFVVPCTHSEDQAIVFYFPVDIGRFFLMK
jgi:hypothetical protein